MGINNEVEQRSCTVGSNDQEVEDVIGECKLVTERKMKEFSARVNKSISHSLIFKPGTIITPAAMDVAREKKIDIRFI